MKFTRRVKSLFIKNAEISGHEHNSMISIMPFAVLHEYHEFSGTGQIP